MTKSKKRINYLYCLHGYKHISKKEIREGICTSITCLGEGSFSPQYPFVSVPTEGSESLAAFMVCNIWKRAESLRHARQYVLF